MQTCISMYHTSHQCTEHTLHGRVSHQLHNKTKSQQAAKSTGFQGNSIIPAGIQKSSSALRADGALAVTVKCLDFRLASKQADWIPLQVNFRQVITSFSSSPCVGALATFTCRTTSVFSTHPSHLHALAALVLKATLLLQEAQEASSMLLRLRLLLKSPQILRS